MTEIWKDVPSYPKLQASSFGRIRQKPYLGNMPAGHGKRLYGGKPSVGSWDGKRYRFSRRWCNPKNVARLVCEAFNGPSPFDGALVMHCDENARNNKPWNLKWATQQENMNCPKFLEYASRNCRRKMAGQPIPENLSIANTEKHEETSVTT